MTDVVHLHLDGSAEVEGIDLGPLTVHHEDSRTLVLKSAGHSRYTGQGAPWVYAPVKFHVFRLLSERGEGPRGEWVAAERITSFPLR